MFTIAVVSMKYVEVKRGSGGGGEGGVELRAPPRVVALPLQRRDAVTATTPSQARTMSDRHSDTREIVIGERGEEVDRLPWLR